MDDARGRLSIAESTPARYRPGLLGGRGEALFNNHSSARMADGALIINPSPALHRRQGARQIESHISFPRGLRREGSSRPSTLLCKTPVPLLYSAAKRVDVCPERAAEYASHPRQYRLIDPFHIEMLFL